MLYTCSAVKTRLIHVREQTGSCDAGVTGLAEGVVVRRIINDSTTWYRPYNVMIYQISAWTCGRPNVRRDEKKHRGKNHPSKLYLTSQLYPLLFEFRVKKVKNVVVCNVRFVCRISRLFFGDAGATNGS